MLNEKKEFEKLRNNISKGIEKQLEINGLNQKELAEILKVDNSTVGKWINKISIPRMGIIQRMSDYFGVEKSYFLEGEEKESEDFDSIPLVGQIAAGTPILAKQNIERYFIMDKSIKADFALRIKGDSMINAGIYENDIVFIRRQPDVENGEIGAVQIEDIETEATLKRVYRDDDSITLIAENPKYPPRIFTNGNIKILGKLVAVLNIRE